jgi:aspartyl-tRNA(Asn)/glutamyl-tRNA(Gln) amidotransferase subunit A
MSLHTLSAAEASKKIRSGAVSPVELVQTALARIAQTDDEINAFSEVFEAEALDQARQAERELREGFDRGPLHGIPVAIKDIFDVAGYITVADTEALPRVASERDAAVVTMLRTGGAVILGKTHVHECAYGCTTPSTRNPWNRNFVPGGSSGGSAAALAAGQCWFAVGSDTGGSIRAPSSHCGVVGFKPTYDLVSRSGCLPLSWSLDHVGPMGRSVGDVAAGLGVITGNVSRYSDGLELGVAGLKIGIPKNYYFDDIEPNLRQRIGEAIEALRAAGATLIEVEIPYARQLLPAHFCIMFAEASTVHRDAIREQPDSFGDDVRMWLRVGALIPAADYLSAQRARRVIADAWRRKLTEVDALVVPAVAAPASRVGEMSWAKPDGAEESILSAFSRLAAPANLLGLPAVSVPCGFVDPGLPVGLQIIGRLNDDAMVLRIARAYERTQSWEGQIADF